MTTSDLLNLAPVVPVVVIDDPADAVPLAKALHSGGIPLIEVTLRTPGALQAVRAIADELPEMVVGAGTVTSPELATRAVAHGARFLVSPGSTDRLLDALLTAGVPALPGVATASETLRVLERGQREMKFFPAEASGGRPFLAGLAAALAEARFCPTGGITPATAPEYLELPNVPCVGGTWLTPRDLIAARQWPRIEELAAQAARLGH